jgi:hypothetical protein
MASPMKEPKHPILAHGKVRYVGEQIALVVAESAVQARDAGEMIEVDYEALPAVVDVRQAVQSGAPTVHDEAADNVCYVWALGDKAATDATFKHAAHVTTLEFINNRLIPNALEPRACNAAYTRADDSYTLYVSNQNPHVERLLMTAFVLGLPEHKVRVIAPDVGGGFGSKIYLYAEETGLRVGFEDRWPSRSSGRRIAPRRSSRTPTGATTTRRRSSRSTRTARCWGCACRRRPRWAPISRPSHRASRPSSMRRCSRGSTARRRSTAR